MAASLLLSSAALAWMAWERGEVELHLLIIFPVLKASGAMGAASLLLAFLAFIAFVYALWTGYLRWVRIGREERPWPG